MAEGYVLGAELTEAACELADLGGLGQLPHPARRAFVDALQAALDAGERLATLSAALAAERPRDLLSLDEPVRAFLTSPEGLGIEDADLPADAMEYLALVVFLRGEMAEGKLPYRTFDELSRAAQEGRTLAEGLAQEDRERLVRTKIAPELRRLWPRDEQRVAAEVARLLES